MDIKEIGIGIIGCGNIACNVHLPAYRKAGYKVVAAADMRQEAVDRVQSGFGIPQVFTDYHEMLKLDEVQVVDVATHAPQHVPVATDVVNAGKHAWVQKPFSDSFEGVPALVALAKQKGVKLGVNQNSNWVPGFIVAKEYLDAGYIGEPYLCTIENRAYVAFHDYRMAYERFVITAMGIHHIDLVRQWFGEPVLVHATATKDPAQSMKGEMAAFVTMEYEGPLRVLLIEDWAQKGPSEDRHPMEKIIINGTKGRIIARSEGVEVYSECLPSPPSGTGTGIVRPTVQGKWFTDAFAGSMGEMLTAIAEDREPLTSGEDNIKSMQVAFAAYRSIEEKRAVAPSEIEG